MPELWSASHNGGQWCRFFILETQSADERKVNDWINSRIAVIALEFRFGYAECVTMPLPTLNWFADKAMERIDKKNEQAKKAESSARSARSKGKRRR